MVKLHISTEPYRTRRSKAQGEKDLFEIVDNEEKEGAFLFNRGIWQNIALKHEVDENKVRRAVHVNPDEKIKWEKAIHYHTHPLSAERLAREEYIAIAKRWGSYKFLKPLIFETTAAALVSFPSFKGSDSGEGDIEASALYLANNPDCNIEFAIVSPHGIMKYKILRDHVDSFIPAYERAWGDVISCRVDLFSYSRDMSRNLATATEMMNNRLYDEMKFEFCPRNNN